ncbi:putative BPI/LBP family protein At1g04970 [Juglans microcarpa x Juglans regia]|uniref:putative BPI/LBP family protein At1g04970 n=1 Tax=Juglans microcarpa x Juglans regia TaxID=2249226 RepID=UPI001B7DC7AF|nr:putative BPI/LBP family protein At1g04970 [Juglans microcarpa x Juglans regia]
MAPTILFVLMASFFIPTNSHLELTDQAFTSVALSQQGLDFVKNLLIDEAISSIIPLQLPKIEKSVKIPFVGNVHMVLSNTTIYKIDVSESYVKPGDTGIAIIVAGATCNLSMNWYYSYSTWLVPVEISDRGSASVQVEGMEVGLTLGLENQEGTLKLSLMECGCYVKEISVILDGGASWLYQGMVDAFEGQIGSAVEKAITKKLDEGILKLDSFLQTLPKEIPVDDNASLNITFVNDPLLSNSSIVFEINGLFTGRKRAPVPKHRLENSQSSVFCPSSSRMLAITLDEAVFNSASTFYYNASFMQWIVDKVPDQSLLNTGGWRFIVPQLYKKYPNDDMNLNMSLSSPPVIRIAKNNIDAVINLDLVIDVLEAGKVIPVACITLIIRGSGLVKIAGNNLAGSVKLNDFTMSLKWSNIGNLRLYLIQPVMWTLIQTVFLPYANSHLAKGFPLPIIHGFTLYDADIICSDSRIMVCSDVSYKNQTILSVSNALGL